MKFVVLGLDQDIARIFGSEDARLRRSGRTNGSLDLLIAATALHYDLAFLTTDRDFERVENLHLIFL